MFEEEEKSPVNRKKQIVSRLDANSDYSVDKIDKQIVEDLEKSESKNSSFANSDGSSVKFPRNGFKGANNKSSGLCIDTTPCQSKEFLAEGDYYIPDANDGQPNNGGNTLGLPGLSPLIARASDSEPFPRRSNLILNYMETLAITGKFNELDDAIKWGADKRESTIMKE